MILLLISVNVFEKDMSSLLLCKLNYLLFHRTKSKSTPILDAFHKQDAKGLISYSSHVTSDVLTCWTPHVLLVVICALFFLGLQGAVKRRARCHKQNRNVCRFWRRWERGHSCLQTAAGYANVVSMLTKSPPAWEHQSGGASDQTSFK